MHFFITTLRNAIYFCCVLGVGYLIYSLIKSRKDLIRDSLKFLVMMGAAAVAVTFLYIRLG